MIVAAYTEPSSRTEELKPRPTEQPRGTHAFGQINCVAPAFRRGGGGTVISKHWRRH
jgi:hypothetical protein